MCQGDFFINFVYNMTIQWTLIAVFLYLELGIITLLMLTFISPKIWKCILQFHLWEDIARKANTYFMVFLMVLVLFLLDSIREMVKYTGKHLHDYEAELQMHMKLYRSQRNYYIAGMALFLSLVIRRLTMLILTEYELIAKNEETMKNAQEATENLEKLMREEKTLEVQNALQSEKFMEVKELENLLKSKDNELKSAKQEIATLEMRSLQVLEQYNELHGEISNLKS